MKLAGALASILVFAAVLAAAASDAVGTWDATVTGAGGGSKWTMVLKEADGKLSGVLSGPYGEHPMLDLKAESGKLSYRVVVEGGTYDVKLTIDGAKMTGTWNGSVESGTLSATRRP